MHEFWLEPQRGEVWVAAAYPYGLGDELLAYDLEGHLKQHGPAPANIILDPVLPLNREILKPLFGMKQAPDSESDVEME